jgi:hypothetical protein
MHGAAPLKTAMRARDAEDDAGSSRAGYDA